MLKTGVIRPKLSEFRDMTNKTVFVRIRDQHLLFGLIRPNLSKIGDQHLLFGLIRPNLSDFGPGPDLDYLDRLCLNWIWIILVWMVQEHPNTTKRVWILVFNLISHQKGLNSPVFNMVFYEQVFYRTQC